MIYHTHHIIGAVAKRKSLANTSALRFKNINCVENVSNSKATSPVEQGWLEIVVYTDVPIEKENPPHFGTLKTIKMDSR